MAFDSANAFRDFAGFVRRERRYVWNAAQESFLGEVIATSNGRIADVKAGCIMWRAQLGCDWREDEAGEFPRALPPARMKPMSDNTTDGRANPRAIPCLYLATKKDTAVLEVRPPIGSYVSVAQFKMMRDVRLVNCADDTLSGADNPIGNLERWSRKDWTSKDIETIVWTDINEAFSEPVERGDSSVDYVPTQILAEAFKRHGFDGLAYRSGYGEDGFNLALFDLGVADLINCGLYRVKDVTVVLQQEDNPYFVSQHVS